MKWPAGRAMGPRTPIVVALVVSGFIWASAILIRGAVQDASALVERGLGQALETAGRESLGGDHYPPDTAALQAFLDQHSDEGLRYVALLGDDGAVLASAGVASSADGNEAPAQVSGQPHLVGLTRLVGRIAPRRPAPGTPPQGDGRRPISRVVYEFAPLISFELKRRSTELLIIAAICSAGVMLLAIALFRSLLHRERMAAELENGRRLAALGTMSAVLAHEIRNPLASLKGHAQLLAEAVEADTRLSPKVGRVVSEAVRLERLTNELLDFVKSGELQRAQVDAASILRAAVAATDSPLVDATYPAGPLLASVDAGRLQQALENVLRNALQASPKDGRVEAALTQEADALVFTIRDHGPGLPPGDEEKIFEPFVTGRTHGVGLGLAITRKIVEQHQGRLTARNLPSGGAEFTFRIPLVAKQGA